MTWIIPPSGSASLTHYDLPLNFLAACGCAYGASYHATAAISALAYSGDERASVGPGPGCGRCFRLTLQSAHGVSPPFVPADPKPSVVVKIIGQQIHFDLALPSPALNLSFFPSNPDLYGYSDFGVWNINYQTVSCEEWTGWSNKTNLGVEPSYPGFEESCCPINPPYTSDLCPKSIKAPPPSSAIRSTGSAFTPFFLLILVSSWLAITLPFSQSL
ncbi:hypothetical protein PtA15_12A257 [Puccinia triticina]|uniref:Expansin-like EG45 domain-containing protein n=1 Tax=Puccinia triticina TaxID=208348 RepID=A0ABY7CY72_9BASI|nr:uncharacterized protein PtA15_12A257 [Puccinia triticina]WAQ90269.1 hypothetical protein PtA15_12A257 [Puccinia triticina]